MTLAKIEGMLAAYIACCYSNLAKAPDVIIIGAFDTLDSAKEACKVECILDCHEAGHTEADINFYDWQQAVPVKLWYQYVFVAGERETYRIEYHDAETRNKYVFGTGASQ
jgi:hypothetical protein